MTKMTYAKTITKEIKPTVVNLSLLIKTTGKNPSETVNKLTNLQTFCIEFIKSKTTCTLCKSANISFKKVTKTEYCYKHKENPSKIIAAELINKLDSAEIANYEKVSIEIFDYYESTVYITVTLRASDNVIEDFTDIINMCVEKEIRCTYKHDITAEERQQYNIQMHTECIKTAVTEIREIVRNTGLFYSTDINILEITEHSNNSNAKYMCTEKRMSGYTPEQYFIPELIKELFNNNIELSKSLDFLIEF